MMKRKKMTQAQIEAKMEREGQVVLPGFPVHSHRGGRRAGAGRKSQAVGGEPRKRTIHVSDYEYQHIQAVLRELRGRGKSLKTPSKSKNKIDCIQSVYRCKQCKHL